MKVLQNSLQIHVGLCFLQCQGDGVSLKKSFGKNLSLNFINNLKIRASWGKMGDDGALAYQFLNGYYVSGRWGSICDAGWCHF